MACSKLLPGFRFHPTDQELVVYYLRKKVMGKKMYKVISVLDIYKFAPQDLPDKSCLKSRDLEWYFFCPRERKYSNGGRINRTAVSGYWKTTGKDKKVDHENRTVGQRRTLIFHHGRAPEGNRTDWVMHEYRLEDEYLADKGIAQDEFVLCKIFQKSGRGPQNGAQYGAPFKEEEWDNEDESDQMESLPFSYSSVPGIALNDNQSSLTTRVVVGPGDIPCEFPSDSGPSQTVPPVDKVFPSLPDELVAMMEAFHDNDENEVGRPSHAQNVDNALPAGGNEIRKDLADPNNLVGIAEDAFNSCNSGKAEQPLPECYLELNDLDLPLACPVKGCGSGSQVDKPSHAQNVDDALSAGENDIFKDLIKLDQWPFNEPFLELKDFDCAVTSPPGGVCMDHSCSSSESFDHQCFCFGGMHCASALNPSTSLPANMFYGSENCMGAFPEKWLGSNVMQGYAGREHAGHEHAGHEHAGHEHAGHESASYNRKRSEPESGHEAQTQKRGGDQKKSYSKLQQLMESIPSRSASAAEHSFKSNGHRESTVTVLCPSVGGGGGWCTEEGVSDKLEKLSCLGYCGCNLHRRREFRKEETAVAVAVACPWDRIFMFVLPLLALMWWAFISAIILKLGRFAWDLLLS